jgi:hypothetical protein
MQLTGTNSSIDLIVLIINIHQGSPKVILMISSVLDAERLTSQASLRTARNTRCDGHLALRANARDVEY